MKRKDKSSADLHRLLNTQEFKSEEELKTFLDSLVGETITSFEKEALSPQEEAEDLVYKAWESEHPLQAMALVVEALELDPDCIAAYEYLASIQPSPHAALPMYAHGVQIGREKFGGKFMKENKGDFWLIHETRPFMRCLHLYASCLYTNGKKEKGIVAFGEMITLNPNDNQGARFEYMLYLLDSGRYDEFTRLEKMFEYEQTMAALFNRALHEFLTKGDAEQSREHLKKGMSANKHLANGLLRKSLHPDDIPGMYSPGSKDEALVYASYAWDIWNNAAGARDWLKKNKK